MTELTPQCTHLYYEHWRCWDWHVCDDGQGCYEVRACPVTRVTAKRIYFRGADNGPKSLRDREWFVSRRDIEGAGDVVGQLLAGGGVYHRGLRQVLHLHPPQRSVGTAARQLRPIIEADRDSEKSVAELRREAAEAHPDRGGDPAAFRAAYARYARAKAVAR
jgi:hypothetical protein